MIVVGTTLAAYVMDQEDTWGAWLYNAEKMIASTDEEVRFFAAIQVDRRGIAPFEPLVKRLLDLVPDHRRGFIPYWTYSLDDGRTEVTTRNRLRHLTTGQNLVSTYASDERASHLLFMAADCAPPPDVIPKLVECRQGIIGAHVRTYNFAGRRTQLHREVRLPIPGEPTSTSPAFEHVEVMEHFPTAACVMIRRDVFTRLRWRVDIDRGMTDDPAYAFDAEKMLGIKPLIRMDVVAKHYPEAVGAIEGRGHDMTVVR